MSTEYIASVSASWDRIETIVQSMSDDYSIIITADHGGHDRSHGSDVAEDMTIPLFLKGKAFNPDVQPQDVNSSYVARINYAAAIAEIIRSLMITKAAASMAVTGSFLTYGLGQIFSGILGDRIKPRTIIFVGLIATSVCNLIMFSLSNVYIMTVVWCLNGLAQSMLWPPLTRIMSENLSPREYARTCTWVSASASAATIAIYLIVPLCIRFSGWRAVFLLAAVWALAVGLLWFLAVDKLTSPTYAAKDVRAAIPNCPGTDFRTLFLSSGLLPVMAILLLQGILRDGITTWMPSYINDVFDLGTSISILSTAVLPVFAIMSVIATLYLYKIVKNEFRASAFLWLLTFICSVVLVFVFSSHAAASILLMAIVTGSMHGINLMLISILPARFAGTGQISTVSGILNAFTYGGSAVSSYGIAALNDNFGWKPTVIAWSAIALVGTVLTAIHIARWSRVR